MSEVPLYVIGTGDFCIKLILAGEARPRSANIPPKSGRKGQRWVTSGNCTEREGGEELVSTKEWWPSPGRLATTTCCNLLDFHSVPVDSPRPVSRARVWSHLPLISRLCKTLDTIMGGIELYPVYNQGFKSLKGKIKSHAREVQ